MSTCDLPRRGALPGLVALVALVALALLRASPAAAQSAEDQATARTLFNEARGLMKGGHYDEACTKLEAASRLYSGSGLLLNLGDCYEHVGKTASAWTEFGEAVSAAERAGRADDRSEARRRQTAIEPKLSRLAIRVAHAAPGQIVKRDGSELDRGAWGEAIPVDPGKHTVTAEGPGRLPWSGSASVTEPGKTVSLDVPELPPAPTPAPSPALAPASALAPTPSDATTEPASYWTPRRIASATLTGVGVATAGVGGVLAIVAKSQDDTAKSEVSAHRNADSTGAANLGNVATVLLGAGAAVAATGLVLWLTAPSAQVQVGASAGRLVVGGSF